MPDNEIDISFALLPALGKHDVEIRFRNPISFILVLGLRGEYT
jgi:hypothetical protein